MITSIIKNTFLVLLVFAHFANAEQIVCDNLEDVAGGTPGNYLWSSNLNVSYVALSSANSIDWEFVVLGSQKNISGNYMPLSQGIVVPQMVSGEDLNSEIIDIAGALLFIKKDEISSYQIFELSDANLDPMGMTLVRVFTMDAVKNIETPSGVIYFIGWGLGRCQN